MNVDIGQIIYEQVLSLDVDNNPITGATFDSVLYFNDMVYSGSPANYVLTDDITGVFTFSWSGDSYGHYQLYAKNNSTNVVFVSDIVEIKPTQSTNIYIGL